MALTTPHMPLRRHTDPHPPLVTRESARAGATFRRGDACGKPAQRFAHPHAGCESVPRARSSAICHHAANELEELAAAGPAVFVILPPMNSESQPKLAPSRIDTMVGTMAFIGDMSLPSKIRPAMLAKP